MDVTKNRYLANGHNYQADRLPIYLPGNGVLLTTIAIQTPRMGQTTNRLQASPTEISQGDLPLCSPCNAQQTILNSVT